MLVGVPFSRTSNWTTTVPSRPWRLSLAEYFGFSLLPSATAAITGPSAGGGGGGGGFAAAVPVPPTAPSRKPPTGPVSPESARSLFDSLIFSSEILSGGARSGRFTLGRGDFGAAATSTGGGGGGGGSGGAANSTWVSSSSTTW